LGEEHLPNYHPEIPLTCPPNEAEQLDVELFKAIDGTQPKDKDFKSFAERKRDEIDLADCRSWGLSVWPNMEAVEHALGAYPHFQKKRIVKFSVTKDDGSLRMTPSKMQPDHHTFWKAIDCNLLNSCEIVINPGAV
jgi:hypothetical protein